MNMKADNDERLLHKAIVRTVAYFDMFDFPVTDFEVWKFLSEKCGYIEVRNILNSMSLRGAGSLANSSGQAAQSQQGALTEIASPRGGARNGSNVIETKNGFYFLKGREEIIRTRLDRYNFTNRKFKRALRVAKIYRLIPWIKMISVSNIIGAHNLKDESDIDFFIITAKGKIWLTRFFSAGLAKILGLRPSEGNSRDKICLNFYASEEAMNLEKFMLNGRSDKEAEFPHGISASEAQDIYFIYWLANLITIYEKGDMYKKFIQANGWLKNYLPNWQPVLSSDRRTVRSGENKAYKAMINLIFGHLEKILKNIQLKLMPKEITALANKDSRVVINDNILKLHVKDRREEYRKNYELRIMNYE
jgi:hypothetical protein